MSIASRPLNLDGWGLAHAILYLVLQLPRLIKISLMLGPSLLQATQPWWQSFDADALGKEVYVSINAVRTVPCGLKKDEVVNYLIERNGDA